MSPVGMPGAMASKVTSAGLALCLLQPVWSASHRVTCLYQHRLTMTLVAALVHLTSLCVYVADSWLTGGAGGAGACVGVLVRSPPVHVASG